ncbi:MAG: PorV/PorQ family protein [Balneolaceae bacterium]
MKKLSSLLVALIFSPVLFAQSGLQLLQIAPTPQELSRSEASVATPNGSASIYSNPALLALSEHTTIGLGYTNWISDSNNLFGGINFKKSNRAVAFSFYTSGVSGLEQRDGPGESNGSFDIQYLSISGAYAYDFKLLAVGVSAHYLNEEIFPYRATGYAFNAGIASSFLDEKLRVGASIQNIGEMEELNEVSTELPTSFTIGFSADVLEFSHYKKPDLPISITVMADFVSPIETNDRDSFTDYNPEENFFNFGVGFVVAEVVEINGGYKTGDNTRPYSFGLGLITDKVTFNYALIPFNTGFGTVHSIGIQYQL